MVERRGFISFVFGDGLRIPELRLDTQQDPVPPASAAALHKSWG